MLLFITFRCNSMIYCDPGSFVSNRLPRRYLALILTRSSDLYATPSVLKAIILRFRTLEIRNENQCLIKSSDIHIFFRDFIIARFAFR